MKCNFCGKDIPDNSNFCGFCGNSPVQNYGCFMRNSVRDTATTAFGDQLFLVLCILLSVSVGVTFLFSGTASVITVLVMAYCWVIFSQVRKGQLTSKPMRVVSGALFAQYILYWIAFAVVALASVAFFVMYFMFKNDPLFLAEFDVRFRMELLEIGNGEEILELYNDMLNQISIETLFIIFAVVFLIAAAVILVVGVIGIKKLHRFAKSLYTGVDMGTLDYMATRSAKNWLLVYAVLNGISALNILGGGAAFVSPASNTAVFIISYILVGKYFNDNSQIVYK